MCAKKTTSKNKRILVSDDFYSDLSAPDMIYAVLVRSPFAYGKIVSVGLKNYEQFPEGYTFLTYEDIPGKKSVTTFDSDFPVFCDGTIRYKGEPVGILTGPDKKLLAELSSKIVISLDKTQISEYEKKFSENYPHLSTSPYTGTIDFKDNDFLKQKNEIFSVQKKGMVSSKEISVGNTAEIFEKAESNKDSADENQILIIEGKWENEIQHKSNKEPDGVFCFFKGGNLHVCSPNQWISHMRKTLSEVLLLPDEKIITTRTNISGQNGNSIWKNSLLAVRAALAAKKTDRPVMLILSRDEQEKYITNPTEVTFSCRTALDRQGLIQAIEILIELDIGIYNPFAKEILERLMIASTGIYTAKNLKIKGKIYHSNMPPSALNFSTIDARAFFAIENQMQKISEATGISPVELREKNLGILSPKNNPMPFKHELGNVKKAIEAVCTASDFHRKSTIYRLAEKNRLQNSGTFSLPSKGIGLACAFEGSGFLGSSFKNKNTGIQLTLTEEKKLIVNTLPPSNSIKEIWLKMISDGLSIDKKNINFEPPLTPDNQDKISMYTTPETLLGSISIKTSLLQKCIDSIKRRKTETYPFVVKKSLSPSRVKLWNQETFSGVPFYNTAFGACTVEVELDECTYREKILKICVVIDGGKILHQQAAKKAIRVSIQKTLSLLMENEILKCHEKDISIQFINSDDEPKQIGHIIASILPPAFTAALSQTVSCPVGKLPLQTDTLFKIYEPEASK